MKGKTVMVNPNRPVGFESRKAYARRNAIGFWDMYASGARTLDIGYRGGIPDALTIVPGAIGIERGLTPGYDGFQLPVEDGTVDTIHASHVLEHLDQPVAYLREWFRALNHGGYLIITVPHAHLYERRLTVPPSRWSPEHLCSFTPASLLCLVEEAFEPNTYRVRHLEDEDLDYDYALGKDQHPTGALEICMVLQKIAPPAWKIDP